MCKWSFRGELFVSDARSRGTLVEYTVPPTESADYDMEQVMKGCRICIVRHKKVYQGGNVTYNTNIWAFSDDLTVRFEQNRKSPNDDFGAILIMQSTKILRLYRTRPSLRQRRYRSHCRLRSSTTTSCQDRPL
jgi:hypothetical protein